MEAGGEAVAVVAADVGEPERAVVEGVGVAAFGHEKEAVAGELESVLERLHFLEVRPGADHEFEDGLGVRGEEGEGLGDEPELFVHPGVGEFGRDVELGGKGQEVVVGNLRAIGFDFEMREIREESGELGEFLLLQERLATGEDEAVALMVGNEGGELGRGEFDDLFLLREFAIVLVFPGRLFPVPSVGGVAPSAVQIAEGEAEKNGRSTEAGAFSLQGVKDLGGAVGQAGDFHQGSNRVVE